jgi:23S rRNA pseudoU1915 N3-methylase RlmH
MSFINSDSKNQSKSEKLFGQNDQILNNTEHLKKEIQQLRESLDEASRLISLKFKEKNTSIVNLDKVVKEIKTRNNSNIQLHDLGTTKPEDIFITYEENGKLHIWAYGLK